MIQSVSMANRSVSFAQNKEQKKIVTANQKSKIKVLVKRQGLFLLTIIHISSLIFKML